MLFVERPADAFLASWAARREGPRLVTVHGIAGSGTSSSVARALAGRRVVRVDLGGTRDAAGVRSKLRTIRDAEIVFVDEVHRPRAAREPIDALLERMDTRIVVAARAPLGSEHEHRVPLGLLDAVGTQALLSAELARLGVHPMPELRALVAAVAGWPLAARAAAVQARVLGVETVVSEIARDLACRAAIDDATRGLSRAAHAMLAALALARAEIHADEAADRFAGGLDALVELVDRGLAVSAGGLVRIPLAAFLRERARGARARAARRDHAELVLAVAERARAAHRRDPIAHGAALERLHDDLVALSFDRDPRVVARAAMTLEPVSIGRLARQEVLSLWSRARHAAASVDDATRAAVALGLARTYIARGDHDNANAVLVETDALASDPVSAAYRAIYLAHISAWRGRLVQASALLDDAIDRIASATDRDRAADAYEDALVQRVFVAFQAGDLDEAERIARVCAELAAARPSPRVVALVRRFSAEVMIRRGAPERAVPLLRRTRDELASHGDHAGAIFTASRVVEALRAAGEHEAAEEEAQAARLAAARAGEGTLEVTVLGADGVSRARVADLVWRVQIPALREQAERWLTERPDESEAIVLRIDRATATATIGNRSICLARRATLWRMLDALVEAHERVGACSCESLFRVGWSGERAEPASQKKRVQTAVWTLRRDLLGNVLATRPEGYALSPDVRIERVG